VPAGVERLPVGHELPSFASSMNSVGPSPTARASQRVEIDGDGKMSLYIMAVATGTVAVQGELDVRK
jgi:hypothetical protein